MLSTTCAAPSLRGRTDGCIVLAKSEADPQVRPPRRGGGGLHVASGVDVFWDFFVERKPQRVNDYLFCNKFQNP